MSLRLKPHSHIFEKSRMKINITIILLVVVPCLALGQFGSRQDTSKLDPQLTSEYQELFRNEWSAKFIELWNKNPDTAKALGGIGTVHFVALGTDTVDVMMNFDSVGKATLLNVADIFPADTLPTFSTRLGKWAEFMEGKFGAVKGVLMGYIKYKGPMALAFKYGFHFDKVAPFGKRVIAMLNQQKKK